ncbi:sigma-70 family RNA polymerase sigma factor [Mariniblastus fucicola]|uniref:RNA polymerase sigma factor n=1 Tax=Mariniblastus fucicola TaxID=980251 RepID=A0A5B9P9I6_9BACT|nr:sigma-70 family RNA polymerase sigma factor [Mariniblastus fucicola]QEG21895.1 RNA polymerase sigma factor [Mariniblastus fucicola]
MAETTRVSLLQQLRCKQDSRAWSKFVHLYTPLICQWVADLRVPTPQRNDVVQEVFIVLLGKISTFQYDAKLSFRGWLRTVTINKCRDFLRKQNRLSEPTFVAHLELAEADDTQLLTQQEYRSHLAANALSLMKKHFSETTWRACWEHVAKGRPAPEVAAELGISPNAVYLARGRVLQRLKQELAGLWE